MTVAVPRLTPLVSVSCAIPLASVATVAAESVPAVVLKSTFTPTAGLPEVFVTVARMTVDETPSAGSVVAPEIKTRLLTTEAEVLTITLAVLLTPVLVVAVMMSVPAALPAVYATVAMPLTLVTAVALPSVGRPLAFVVMENVTTSPTTGFVPSVT